MIKKTNYNICVFAPEIHDPVSHDFIKGINSSIKDHHIDIVSAGGLFDISGNVNSETYLYKKVLQSQKYDGLIIFAGSLANFTTTAYSKEFLKFLPSSLPTICLSVEIPGFSFLRVDNYTPMYDLVYHLISEHSKRRIAFIKGPEAHREANERYQGYKDALVKGNIPIDESIIFKGNYTPYSGSDAVKELLKDRENFPEAIVCSDDDTALGVYAEFGKHKIDITKEGIAVTGFDNMDFAKGMEPELTTIDQSLFLQGKTAFKTLLDKIENRSLKEPVFQPKIIYRKSCGCTLDHSDKDASLKTIYDSQIPELSYHKIIVRELFDTKDPEKISDGIKDLVSLYSSNNYNLVTLADIINTIYYNRKNNFTMEEIIEYSELVQKLNFLLLKENNTLKLSESRNYHYTSSELARIMLRISKSVTYDDLFKAIDRDYYFVGIKSLSFTFPGTENSELKKLEEVKFTKDKHINLKTSKYYSLYHPITTKYEQGYSRLEVDETTFETAEVITNQIARALYTIELFSELDDKLIELQSSYDNLKITKDLLIESEQLAKLGSSVATFTHELNNPIGIGVTAVTHLQDKLSKLKEKYRLNQLTKSELDKHLEDSQSVADILLTNLERATSLTKVFKQIAVDQSSGAIREFNLISYLNEVIHSLSPVLKKTKHKISLTSSSAVTIKSYPGIFSQIISNLIQNSLLHGFENIDKGNIWIALEKRENRLTISYRDDGKGIDKAHIDSVFDSYFTTKGGKGGSGLGLAIIEELVHEKLEGTVKCTSSLGKGVEFIIDIPVEFINNKSP